MAHKANPIQNLEEKLGKAKGPQGKTIQNLKEKLGKAKGSQGKSHTKPQGTARET